jgi:hypothetical protein
MAVFQQCELPGGRIRASAGGRFLIVIRPRGTARQISSLEHAVTALRHRHHEQAVASILLSRQPDLSFMPVQAGYGQWTDGHPTASLPARLRRDEQRLLPAQ